MLCTWLIRLRVPVSKIWFEPMLCSHTNMDARRLTGRQRAEHGDVGDVMCLYFGGETRPVAFSGAWPKVRAWVTITSWTVTLERQCVENLRLAASAWKPRRHFSGAGSDEVGACRERFPSGSMILVASTFDVGSRAMDRQFEHLCKFV